MKKNIRKIPQTVRNKLRKLDGSDIVAGCARRFSAEVIQSGELSHLGIVLRDDGLQYPERVIPRAEQGKFSRRNVEGWEEVRKDLPLETHYNEVECPNWGDSYNGTHTVSLPYNAYPRDFHPPRELEIVLHCENRVATQGPFIIAARVDEVISQSNSDSERLLFENLNLLQENFGACGVEPADSSIVEYIRTLHLAWEIFPPGSREEALQQLFRGRQPTPQQQDTAESRYDFFESLEPRQIIVGSNGLRRYFGAVIEDDLVVFENVQYGNAIYIMYEDWETLSQRSRTELLSGRLGCQFDRVVHRDGWQTEVQLILAAKRQRKRVINRRRSRFRG